jgi:hypothetical protein
MNTHLQAKFYQLHSLVHWRPRANAALRALQELKARNNNVSRVLDVGAGPGLFRKEAEMLGINYLGIEPNRAFHREFPTSGASDSAAAVVDGTATDIARYITDNDVVLLNGVAHHLSDAIFLQFLDDARRGSSMVILDHDSRLSSNKLCAFIPRVLQRLDAGKFVRPLSAFKDFSGWKLRTLRTFDISVFGLPIWPYFVATYEPIR